ncbi:MAG: cytochrome c biogenesis protein CcdA [Methanobacteriota archaeon]|nr:MAG: cytochrome c biogenesis protein CcdA [Euryarchaeota archaeon]
MGFLEIFAVQFPLGILTALSPCLFPLLPSYLAIIAREKQNNRLYVFFSLIFLLAGLMLVYTIFGLVASALVSMTKFILKNSAAFAIFQGLLLIVIGAFMVWTPSFVTNLQTPNLLNRIFSVEEETSLPVVSFLIGVSFTLIAAPCAASYFLFSWTQASLLSLPEKILSYGLFTAGASIPFLVIALLTPELKATFIKDLNKSSNIIKKFVGVIVIFSGIWLISSRSF